MPPLVHDRWPPAVRETFAEMNRQLERGDIAGVSAGCEHVVKLLAELGAETGEPLRRQVAYAYFDLTYFFQKLGRVDEATWGYEQSRDRWAAIPPDFETHSQSAGCHNHLGLIALDAGDLTRAETAFKAAVEDRVAASRCQAHNADQGENVVYFAGALCNLGTLYRERNDRTEAVDYYDRAIEALTAVMPKAGDPLDEEICNLHKDMWTQIYGMPHWLRTAEQFLASAKAGKAAMGQDPTG